MKNFAHQDAVFDAAKDRPYYGLFLEQGVGKTRIAIQLVEHHYRAGNITAVVVITTKGLVGNWSLVEIPKHSTIQNSVHVYRSDKAPGAIPFQGLTWFLVNVDGTITKRFPEAFKAFLKMHPRFALVVDESTVVKNPSAARTKRVSAISKLAKYRYALSGTPVTNSPLDLYSQCEILSPTALGFKNFYAFKARYAVTVKMAFGMRSFDKIVGYRNMPELTSEVQGFSSILKKTDCLDLPDKLYRTIPVPLTPAQVEHYEALKNEALTYISGEEITVVNTIGLINKLLQICSGQMKMADGSYVSIPTDRLGVLSDLVDECPGKTIVWCSYVGNMADIAKELEDRCIVLPSGLTLEKRHEVIETFKSSDYKALVANPASAGHGITITESSNCIYYSNSWNYENRAQSEDRIHRIGQTEHCLYTDLIAPDTLEGKVVKVLKDKKTMADSLLLSSDFLKELFHG